MQNNYFFLETKIKQKKKRSTEDLNLPKKKK